MPSFSGDIRPLFRDKDVEEMRFAFDLNNYDDVRSNAGASMPAFPTAQCPATTRSD